MSYLNLALFSALLLGYSILSGRQRGRWLDGPLLFMLVGILLGPKVLGWLQPSIGAEGLRLLVEVTLAIVLFSDAAGANQRVAVKNRGLVLRLLLIGLPLTILLGFGVAWLVFPGAPMLLLGLIAVTLAPTDAALGKAVIVNPLVPESVREGLNLESGLNDGICVPLILTLLAVVATPDGGHGSLGAVAVRMVEELGIGALIGGGLAWVATSAIHHAARHEWNSPAWRHLALPGLALMCFGVTQLAGGSGFIAAFVGGLVAGPRLGRIKHSYLEGNEHYGDLLTVLVWVLFGALAGNAFNGAAFDWRIWLYALASLSVIRMVPVVVALGGSSQAFSLRVFMAWFGPRGLASVVFAILIFEQLGKGAAILMQVVVATVVLSVILHGVSAGPWCRRLAQPG